MRRFGIEDESWFEAARTGLERRGFTMRIQPRSIVIEKEARLPRIVASAREFLEFAERQGETVAPATYEAADHYGDDRSDLRRRRTDSPFETPADDAEQIGHAACQDGDTALAERRPEVNAVELRLAELRLEQDRLAAERRAAHALAQDKHRLAERCAGLEAELQHLTAVMAEAVKSRDLWQMSAASAEDRLRLLEAEAEAPGPRGGDKKFDQLRRFLARELHPDLAGEDAVERGLREALFKRVWAKIETLQ